MPTELIAHDMYFRRDNGPVIHVRVWDAEVFAAAERERGWMAEPRYVVAFVDADEYRRERGERLSRRPP